MVKNIHIWEECNTPLYKTSFLSGDAVSDLRTQQNTLSVWHFDDPSQIDSIIGALALGRQKIQKLAYLVLDEDDIRNLGIPMQTQIGDAAGLTDQSILQSHLNLEKIDYWRIGFLAEYFEALAKDETRRGERTKQEVQVILVNMVKSHQINIDEVNKDIKEDLQKVL